MAARAAEGAPVEEAPAHAKSLLDAATRASATHSEQPSVFARPLDSHDDAGDEEGRHEDKMDFSSRPGADCPSEEKAGATARVAPTDQYPKRLLS